MSKRSDMNTEAGEPFFRSREPDEDILEYCAKMQAEYRNLMKAISVGVRSLSEKSEELRCVGYGALRE